MLPKDAAYYQALVNLACTPGLKQRQVGYTQMYLSDARLHDHGTLPGGTSLLTRRSLHDASTHLILAGIPADDLASLRLLLDLKLTLT